MLDIQDSWQIVAACNVYSNMHENQQMHLLLFNWLIMCGCSYIFRHYIAILKKRS
jgi:hypothetical protein